MTSKYKKGSVMIKFKEVLEEIDSLTMLDAHCQEDSEFKKYCLERPKNIEITGLSYNDFCLITVGKWLNDYEYIKNPSEELNLLLLKTGLRIFGKIKVKSKSIMELGVSLNPMDISYITKQPKHLILQAVKENPFSITVINKHTEEVCLLAVGLQPSVFRDLKMQTPKVTLLAVTTDEDNLKYVKNQTVEICVASMRKYPFSCKYIKKMTYELGYEAVKINGNLVKYTNIMLYRKERREAMMHMAIRMNPESYMYIHKLNDNSDLERLAITLYGDNIFYAKIQTDELKDLAMENNPLCIKYIDDPKGFRKLKYLIHLITTFKAM